MSISVDQLKNKILFPFIRTLNLIENISFEVYYYIDKALKKSDTINR